MFHYYKRSVLLLAAAGFSFTAFAQNSTGEVAKDWHLKDKSSGGYYGISLDKAYDFVKGKTSKTVIVAVIDSGIDTTHEDLKSVLWTNPGEIPGNGIDDDKNGYIDDVHGWNFIGGKDGRNVKEDSYEAARVYHMYKARFENADSTTLNKQDLELYRMWKEAYKDLTKDIDVNQQMILQRMYPVLHRGDSIIQLDLNKKEFNEKDLQGYKPTNPDAQTAMNIYLNIFRQNPGQDISNVQLMEELESEIRKAESVTKAPRDYRGEIVKDNEADINDKYYGNNDIMAGTPFHGTHVSGIIAANRTNNKGIKGIADNVRIMAVRAVPDGDEHDKDIALAIRYAVDNGARVINMSFGKGFSPQKQWVDDAVRYAESKGVLLVHAAGNDGADIDSARNFPTPVYLSTKTKATNWLTIGASAPKDDLAASFSNFGKESVDVFAPGVDIYSSVPAGNAYGRASGTSMASPVTAGVAALILEYYPTLTPQQVKSVIENSVVKINMETTKPGGEEKVPFSSLSRTGGIVNAYQAVKLAEQLATQKKGPAGKSSKKPERKIKVKSGDDKLKVKEKDNKTKVKTETEKKTIKSF
jgi:subtilisin family serine protease